MIRMIQLACVCVVVSASTAYAQETAPASAPETVDSAALNAVTTYSMKSGRIALSSVANPKPSFLPDGTYTNESGVVLVILEGVIARLQREQSDPIEIASVHLGRDKVIMLVPGTNALMQVSDIRIPSGTFRSADGVSSLKVLSGHPISFTLPASTPKQ